MTNLLPCPFCGGKPEFRRSGQRGHYIACTGCDAASTMFTAVKEDVRDLLIETWNRRTPSPETRVQAPEDFEEKLSDFLEALDEWGCDDNAERAREILEFQRTGYDLDAYLVEHPYRPKSELN